MVLAIIPRRGQQVEIAFVQTTSLRPHHTRRVPPSFRDRTEDQSPSTTDPATVPPLAGRGSSPRALIPSASCALEFNGAVLFQSRLLFHRQVGPDLAFCLCHCCCSLALRTPNIRERQNQQKGIVLVLYWFETNIDSFNNRMKRFRFPCARQLLRRFESQRNGIDFTVVHQE